VTLDAKENSIVCNGVEKMIEFIKHSNEVKEKYQIEQNDLVKLRTSDSFIIGIPYDLTDNNGIERKADSSFKFIKSRCHLQRDRRADFDFTFFYSTKDNMLMATIGTITNKKSFRTGFRFITKLSDNGDLGDIRIEPIQE
jgi:hypothetical protein